MTAMTYHYHARNIEGRTIAGAMFADSADTVIAHLRSRALYVTWIGETASLRGRTERLRTLGGPGGEPIASFFRAFATLLRAAMPIQRALAIAAAQCANRRLAEALRAVEAEVEAGRSLASAMRTRPREFAELHIAMIEAGEAGGMLDDVLERISTMLERDRALRRKLASALAYPSIVLVAAIGLLLFLIASIVPTFSALFEQLNVDLPAPTRLLIELAAVLRNPLVAVAAISAAAAAAAALRRTRPFPERTLDRLLLRSPIAGTLLRRAIVARIARTIGSLLHAGVDILRAFEVAAPVSGSRLYAAALSDVRASLKDGDTVADRLQACGLFDSLAIGLVRVGEETGTLDTMLLKVAEYYEIDVDSGVSALSATLEPLLIIVIGVFVGAIVASIFIPLYSAIGNIH